MDHEALVSAAGTGQLAAVIKLHSQGANLRFDHDAPLREAARNGHLEVVRYLHQNGSVIYSEGHDAILKAAANGHLETLIYLYVNGGDIHAQDDAAIAGAVHGGHFPVVRYLHEHGVSLQKNGNNLMLLAARGGQLDIVRYLHTSGISLSDVGVDALAEAAAQGHIAVVIYLHENGVNPRAKNALALERARESNQDIVVRYLKDKGCETPGAPEKECLETINYYWSFVLPAATGDLDTLTKPHQRGVLLDGAEACIIAAANGQIAIVQYLHQAGCRLEKIEDKAIPLAATNGRTKVLKYFFEHGVGGQIEINSAIKLAAAKGRIDLVKYLHQQGADLAACQSIAELLPLLPSHRPTVNYLSENGIFPEGPVLAELIQAIRTGDGTDLPCNYIDIARHSDILLCVAAERGNLPAVIDLHQSGCNIPACGHNAFLAAAANGHVAVLDYLHNNGLDLSSVIDQALQFAAENGHLESVAFLVKRGAPIQNIKDETLDLIRLNGHDSVGNYLADSGVDALRKFRREISAIHDELYAAKPVYHPSKLWEYFNKVNMGQLRRDGMHSFKRTINQNYFNFLPYSLLDPQLLRLTKWWVSNLTLSPFRVRVIDPDINRDDGKLHSVDRRVFTFSHRFPILSWIARTVGWDLGRTAQIMMYRWLVSMLWDFTRAHDKLQLADRLSEPHLGSPIDIFYQSRRISQDLAHSIIECNSILDGISLSSPDRTLRVAEIGAGYGRLGYVLMHAVKCQYVVLDIPPSLYVSQWYLSELFPEKRIFHFRHFEQFEDIAEELSRADIAFFSANQIELLPDKYFDLSINISSLHELRPDQIDNMLGQIFRITQRYVYLKQYKEYVNPYDGLRLLEDSYKIAPGWRHRYYRDEPVDSRFFETLIESETAGGTIPLASTATNAPEPAQAEDDASLPTLSILLANYNHAEYLPTSLSGICNQTVAAAEIIIVDDGSTDESISVIEEYAQRFSNIRLIRNDKNRGQHHSIQRALLAARGDYIVWAASDDLLLPNFVERSLSLLKRYPDAGLCFSRLAVFVDGSTEVRHYTKESQGAAFDYGESSQFIPRDKLEGILRRHYVWMSGNTVVAKRSLLLEMSGFENKLRWHSDWFVYYVIALRHGVCVIPETLALMRERNDTYSKTGIENHGEQRKVLTALLDLTKSPKYRDLLPIFRRCPSILTLFGRQILFASILKLRHWDYACSLGLWLAPIYLRRLYGQRRYWLSAQRNRLQVRILGWIRH